MPTQAPPPAASKYYALSALAALEAAREAAKSAGGGVRRLRAAGTVLIKHQVRGAVLAERAVGLMLDQQPVNVPAPSARLNPAAFTTPVDKFEEMASDIDSDAHMARLIESLVQDAARAAQETAVTARPDVAHVRHLDLPSCSRCVTLGGRVYRYSDGFQRHPNCDCIMIPVTVASPDFTHDPLELVRSGQVRGLSKADVKALEDGADFNQVVNVRLRAAGLSRAGRVIERAGRPTPEAIYQATGSDRSAAVALLKKNGYLL